MKYFDFHVHAFTDELASRALSGLAETSGIVPATDGTVTGLRRKLEQNGIDRALPGSYKSEVTNGEARRILSRTQIRLMNHLS